MNKKIRWLLAEVDRWTEDGIVSAEQAVKLKQRYPLSEAEPSWALIVFAVAGAVVIGLGVILLFAYNWDDIPKLGKLALILGAVVATHGYAIFLHAQTDWRGKLGEAMAVLGTMFFGAAIWLIAQIYNIDEHYPNGFLFWGLGALALAWAARSIPQALLATVLLSIWGNCETLEFRQSNFAALALLVVGVLPLALRRCSGLLLATILAGVYFSIFSNVLTWGNGAWAFSTVLALSGFLLGVARLRPFQESGAFPAGGAVMAFFGYTGFLSCAYLLTFRKIAADLLDWELPLRSGSTTVLAYAWVFFVGALATWGLLLARGWRTRRFELNREDWLIPIGLIYAYSLAFAGAQDLEALVAWSFTLIFLSLAVMWMWRGCLESRLRPTVVGSVMLAAILFARFFDLFDSLASRGVAFLLLGGIFFFEAVYFRRGRVIGRANP